MSSTRAEDKLRIQELLASEAQLIAVIAMLKELPPEKGSNIE